MNDPTESPFSRERFENDRSGDTGREHREACRDGGCADADPAGHAEGSSDADACWDLEDLDSAYRRALAATEFLEEEVVAALRDAGGAADLEHAEATSHAEDAAADDGPGAETAGDARQTPGPELAGESGRQPGGSAEATAPKTPPGPEVSEQASAEPESVTQAAILLDGRPRRAPRADPMHVIEAVLFVGGAQFTARRLAALLGAEDRVEAIEELIERLRERYWQQRRPYTIQLEEGGYRMVLRSEFERYRERAYGLAPREVKLSADAIAVLAAVAYRQPISRKQLDELCRQNTAGPLRQLLRLKLVTVERDAGSREVFYRTTPRFLELFGLQRLDDLPEPEDFDFK